MSNRFGRSGSVSLESYLSGWSGLHGGIPPTGLVGSWLRLVHFLVRPLAIARVAPWAVTALGLLLTVAGVVAAASVPLAAGALLLLGGLCDSLDGALAVVRDRVTRAGAVLDAVCDRLSDLCLPLALWTAGAPAPVCVAAGVLAFLHEYLRAVTTSRGVGLITVSERPTRIIVTGAFLLAEGWRPYGDVGSWATAGAVVLLAAGVLGFAQLAISVARRVAEPE